MATIIAMIENMWTNLHKNSKEEHHISTLQKSDTYIDNGSVNYASTFEVWIEHNAAHYVKLRKERGGGGCDCREERGWMVCDWRGEGVGVTGKGRGWCDCGEEREWV